MNERKDAIRDARTLGVPKMLLLGLQHMFAMFGATILVPILVNSYFEGEGLSVQVTLICAGLGTLFFHLCTKLKVPAFLGSSFAFLGGFSTIAQLDTGIFADMTMGEKLPYACGGIVVAGALYLILALVIKVVGVKKVMRFLPPVVMDNSVRLLERALLLPQIRRRVEFLRPLHRHGKERGACGSRRRHGHDSQGQERRYDSHRGEPAR